MIRCLFAGFLSVGTLFGATEFFELPPIKYSATASQDEVAEWAREIEAGRPGFEGGNPLEFLQAVLDRLNVPVESQVLVFSKTSLQTGLINQRNPRALYFSKDAYVGWVPGGKVEVIIEDKKLGPVFYILTMPVGDELPKIVRATDSCLQCHASSRTEGVPGMFIRSVIPDENAHPILSHGTTLVHTGTPVRDRWGGWYVTGQSDGPHLGNRWTIEEEPMEPARQDLTKLDGLIDTSKYLRPTSDIVALMVLEHQCRMHNLLTKAKLNYQRSEYFQKTLHPDEPAEKTGSMAWKSADQLAAEVVAEIFFKDEAELDGDGINGGEPFAETFLKRGVKASRGKSLRQFRLYGRLFKYRCSYMIHSLAFRSLPPLVKQRVIAQMKKVLSEEGDPKFSYLSRKERKLILQILTETFPDWKTAS